MTDGILELQIKHPAMEKGMVQCVHCGTTFGEEEGHSVSSELNLTYGPVVRANSGIGADSVMDTAPDAELVHRDCWSKMMAEIRRAENKSINEYHDDR